MASDDLNEKHVGTSVDLKGRGSQWPARIVTGPSVSLFLRWTSTV